NVGDALFLVADLALDAERAAVADLLQGLNEPANVDLPSAERHLLAPLARPRGPIGILDVDAADVGAEDLHRPDRIAFVVEKHVGGVEVYFQVWTLQLIECQP